MYYIDTTSKTRLSTSVAPDLRLHPWLQIFDFCGSSLQSRMTAEKKSKILAPLTSAPALDLRLLAGCRPKLKTAAEEEVEDLSSYPLPQLQIFDFLQAVIQSSRLPQKKSKIWLHPNLLLAKAKQ